MVKRRPGISPIFTGAVVPTPLGSWRSAIRALPGPPAPLLFHEPMIKTELLKLAHTNFLKESTNLLS